jgi:hypothetical protein
MVKVTDIKLDTTKKEATVSLFADTKTDVTSSTDSIVGFPKGYTISQGSDVMTAEADMAFMKSTGEWNWV